MSKTVTLVVDEKEAELIADALRSAAVDLAKSRNPEHGPTIRRVVTEGIHENLKLESYIRTILDPKTAEYFERSGTKL